VRGCRPPCQMYDFVFCCGFPSFVFQCCHVVVEAVTVCLFPRNLKTCSTLLMRPVCAFTATVGGTCAFPNPANSKEIPLLTRLLMLVVPLLLPVKSAISTRPKRSKLIGKMFPFDVFVASGSLLLLRFVADNDDFLVLVAAGNDGYKPSPDGTVISLCLLQHTSGICFKCALIGWCPRNLQELPISWSFPAQC
jgi:hypothetical protein